MHETNTGTVGPPEPRTLRAETTRAKLNDALKCCLATDLYRFRPVRTYFLKVYKSQRLLICLGL